MQNSPALPCDIVLFGALGDLAQRKLIPALFQLDQFGLLHNSARILVMARKTMTTEAYKTHTLKRWAGMATSLTDEQREDHAALDVFFSKVQYSSLDFQTPEGYEAIVDWLQARPATQDDGAGAQPVPQVYYLATPPSVYGDICCQLDKAGCISDRSRIVVEKPIGHDLESSCEINEQLATFFDERQIFRIDHYLGKETVQNLIALRFANNLFASQWNHEQISHVEITVAEKVGIEGRWSYFDKAGQLRDMVQNHLLQVLCLIAMDPPAELSADCIRDEKLKVLKALRPITPNQIGTHIVTGQYTAGSIEGERVPGYLEEDDAIAHSHTETFIALKVEIDNWRWAGVPFYMRTGKRMPVKSSEIVIHFKPAPHYIFDPDQKHMLGNKLIIRLQPDEGISLRMLTKDQGLDKGMRLHEGVLELTFSEVFKSQRTQSAYERLLWEIIKGDQYLFVRRDEVANAWRWVDSLVETLTQANVKPKRYSAGSWGPVASIAMIAMDGLTWYEDA